MQLGDRSFKTLRILKAEVQRVLGYTNGRRDKRKLGPICPEDIQWVTELMMRHPDADEWIPQWTGVLLVAVDNHKGIVSHCLAARLVDGTDRRFSYHNCLIGDKEGVESRRRERMLRNAIAHQIQHFRIQRSEEEQIKCNYCGATNVPIHVDHVVPFSEILQQWFKQSTKWDCLDAWRTFHRAFDLQLLCAPCNISKGCKPHLSTTPTASL